MEEYRLKNALILYPLRLSDLFIASYARKILLGICCDDEKFSIKTSLIFSLNHTKVIFTEIVNILKALAFDKPTATPYKLLCSYDNFTYLWQINDSGNVQLASSLNDTLIVTYVFSYEQFNELLFLFSQCLIPTLCLKDEESEFLEELTELSFVELVKLKEPIKAKQFLKTKPFNQKYFKLKILTYHLDIVLIINKIKGFCNPSILPNKIDFILVNS
ncbi:MAG: hypothetical protein FJ333_07480 [Sphingomonadales bacterium]|nr:hypothetical protein [Sphingomonadales bacterium]